MIWIYKCNARQHPSWVLSGNWEDVFESKRTQEWGSTQWVPDLARAQPGDVIIAYQTDRNELVGLARVVDLRPRQSFVDLMLRPIRRIGMKVRPLKKADGRIAAIPALQSAHCTRFPQKMRADCYEPLVQNCLTSLQSRCPNRSAISALVLEIRNAIAKSSELQLLSSRSIINRADGPCATVVSTESATTCIVCGVVASCMWKSKVHRVQRYSL